MTWVTQRPIRFIVGVSGLISAAGVGLLVLGSSGNADNIGAELAGVGASAALTVVIIEQVFRSHERSRWASALKGINKQLHSLAVGSWVLQCDSMERAHELAHPDFDRTETKCAHTAKEIVFMERVPSAAEVPNFIQAFEEWFDNSAKAWRSFYDLRSRHSMILNDDPKLYGLFLRLEETEERWSIPLVALKFGVGGFPETFAQRWEMFVAMGGLKTAVATYAIAWDLFAEAVERLGLAPNPNVTTIRDPYSAARYATP